MKHVFGIFALTILASCSSNLTYDREKNCSVKALKAPQPSLAGSEISSKSIDELQSFMKTKLTPEIHQCYQTYLDSAVNPREFAVCTVTTLEKGKVVFVDADDRVNLISDEVKTCIENKISKADWSFFKPSKSVTIHQPFILHAKRK